MDPTPQHKETHHGHPPSAVHPNPSIPRSTPSLVVSPPSSEENSLLQLHRYSRHLPPVYYAELPKEQALMLLALRTLSSAICAPDPGAVRSEPSDPAEDTNTAETYPSVIERDLAAFEKGLSRFLELKYVLHPSDYSPFVYTLVRGATTIQVDIGLRSRLAKTAVALLRKRACVLPQGLPWRPIWNIIRRVHVDCINGAPFIGNEVRESHCRNMLGLLRKCRNFLQPGQDPSIIWQEFGTQINADAPDTAFEPLLLLSHIMPTRGTASLDWVSSAFRVFPSLINSSDWDATWLHLFSRVAKHQPGALDWTPIMPHLYSSIVSAFRLPLGPHAPQRPTEKRCPSHCIFLLSDKMIPSAAALVVFTQSPRNPSATAHLEKLVAVIANYFHPSNGGHWASFLGPFVQAMASEFTARVTEERAATKAGVQGRVIGNEHVKAVAPLEDRLTDDMVDAFVRLFMPLVIHGLHSKSGTMSIQAAAASRDLATVSPQAVVEPLLSIAVDCIESLSSPHRTAVALKLLASLTPVFLDPDLCPNGTAALPQALTLTLPGIDPNDPSKTESTLRFIAGAASRIQSIMASPEGQFSDIAYFLDGYTHQLLDRIFSLLDALEAPPKKGRNGVVPSSNQQLSIFIFIVSMNSLFAVVPTEVVISAAERVAVQVSGSASLNSMKFYGALVRSTAGAVMSSSSGKSAASIFIPRLLSQVLSNAGLPEEDKNLTLAPLSEDELVWRLRMLAQVSRVCGNELIEFCPKLSKVISLGFARSERPIYKAAGRLLRGVLEGLTAIKPFIRVHPRKSGEPTIQIRQEEDCPCDIAWNIPSMDQWTHAEKLVLRFVEEAEQLCLDHSGSAVINENLRHVRPIKLDRDVLFRVVRMLHAVQRGGRWMMAGIVPKKFDVLDKYIPNGAVLSNPMTMTKQDALLALRRPVAAGLGGQHQVRSAALELWRRTYELARDLLVNVMILRPDDGALLYRCLEPFELAHEPFRRSNPGRLSIHACSGYKAAYSSVVATKRAFGAVGGVGRLMPNFIVKLRIESLHETRLSLAARSGIDATDIFESVTNEVCRLCLNDFPRVRSEARGILTRGWRVAPQHLRRSQIIQFIDCLSDATSVWLEMDTAAASDGVVNHLSETDLFVTSGIWKADKRKGKDPLNEVIIGCTSVLKSPSASVLLMRDWTYFDRIVRVLLKAFLVAERPDVSSSIGNLFAKLTGITRPLNIYPFRLVDEDLVSCDNGQHLESSESSLGMLKRFMDLNVHLLEMLQKTAQRSPESSSEPLRTSHEASKMAHWRLQSLVASVLFICIRADVPPPVSVAKHFAESMTSEVISLRQVAVKAVALILALHGIRPEKSENSADGGTPESKPMSSMTVLDSISKVLLQPGFSKELIETLALDRDGNSGSSGSFVGPYFNFGLVHGRRCIDGDTCWLLMNGRPWPMSWVARSARDTFNIAQVRLFESFFRALGGNLLLSFRDPLESFIEAIERKEETVMKGVKNEDARVIVSEVVAGLARGLPSDLCIDDIHVVDLVFSWVGRLLNSMTGLDGISNGGCLIRLLRSSPSGSLGIEITRRLLDSVLQDSPIVVPMDNGATAHIQARRLRYISSFVADSSPSDTDIAVRVAKTVIPDLTVDTAMAHELKSVRDEIARLLSMLAVLSSEEAVNLYAAGVATVVSRHAELIQNGSVENVTDIVSEDSSSEQRKVKSRQGETLSRWISYVFWNGDSLRFGKYLPKLLPVIVSSLDEESDQDRVNHARCALSLAAQGKFDPDTVSEIILVCDSISTSLRYRVRGALLPFLQILAFSCLFTVPEKVLTKIRRLVTCLLSDQQLEVREAASITLIPLIRDAPGAEIAAMRDDFIRLLSLIVGSRSSGRRRVFDSEQIRRRHGAVLGLVSLVMSCPYEVPLWMPTVLVTLASCVSDPPPISTSTRKLFADFMRTHRDEWQKHKLAFAEDQLEIVSDLMVSPSYYA